MNDPSPKSSQTNSSVTPSATSSPASASGPTPSAPRGGLTRGLFGQVVALASRSAVQGSGKARKTSGISGPHSSGSSASVALQSSLASRLQALLGSTGSTLYALTWKVLTTPQRRQICALRASARRTSDSGSTGWPTPVKEDARSSARSGYMITGNQGQTLLDAARAAGWPTPTTHDSKGTDYNRYSEDGLATGRSQALQDSAQLSGWPTPCASDNRDRGKWDDPAIKRRMEIGKSIELSMLVHVAGWPTPVCHNAKQMGYPAEWTRNTIQLGTLVHMAKWTGEDGPARLTATGELRTGSGAEMDGGGQLDPAHSRWLQGLPPAWDDCAPTATRSARRSRRPLSEPTSNSE